MVFCPLSSPAHSPEVSWPHDIFICNCPVPSEGERLMAWITSSNRTREGAYLDRRWSRSRCGRVAPGKHMEGGTLRRLPCPYVALTMSISLNCTSLVLHLPHPTPNLGVEDISNPESGSSLSRQGRDRETVPLPAPQGWDAVRCCSISKRFFRDLTLHTLSESSL